MPSPVKKASSRTPANPRSHDLAILQAEHDYHDCMARFGHDSAEAHAAGVVWRHLRQRQGLAGRAGR